MPPVDLQSHFFGGESSGVTSWSESLRKDEAGELKSSGLKSHRCRFLLGNSSIVLSLSCKGEMSCRDRFRNSGDKPQGGESHSGQGDEGSGNSSQLGWWYWNGEDDNGESEQTEETGEAEKSFGD